jgi:hypothetical protein
MICFKEPPRIIGDVQLIPEPEPVATDPGLADRPVLGHLRHDTAIIAGKYIGSHVFQKTEIIDS